MPGRSGFVWGTCADNYRSMQSTSWQGKASPVEVSPNPLLDLVTNVSPGDVDKGMGPDSFVFIDFEVKSIRVGFRGCASS